MNLPAAALARPWAPDMLRAGLHAVAPPVPVGSTGTVATSFAVFEPIGCVMLGLPDDAHADAAVRALHHAGWSTATLLRFLSQGSVHELEGMVDSARGHDTFGHEVALLRRYLALSRQGCRWLLVKVDGVEHAATAAEVARRCGALLAVHYRMLTVDELL